MSSIKSLFFLLFVGGAKAFAAPKNHVRGLQVRPVGIRGILATPAVVESDETKGSSTLAAAYTVAGSTTILTWTACAVASLTFHPFLKL